MNQAPPLFKNRKEKITAIVLALSTLMSVASFLYALKKDSEVNTLKVQLSECESETPN